MRSFIKSHKRIGSFGKDEKEPRDTSRPSSGTLSNDSGSFIQKQTSFEVVSTNNPNVHSQFGFSSPFNSPTFAAPMSPFNGSPRKEDFSFSSPSSPVRSSRTSSKQYAMPVEDAPSSKKKILKYPKSLFSKSSSSSLRDAFNMDAAGTTIRGSVRHNWDDSTYGEYYRDYSPGQVGNGLRIRTSFGSDKRASMEKPRSFSDVKSPLRSETDPRNESLQKLLGEQQPPEETILEPALIPDVVFVKESQGDDSSSRARPSPVIEVYESRSSVIHVHKEKRASILKRINGPEKSVKKQVSVANPVVEEREPEEFSDISSNELAFSFEAGVNGRNVSIKYYKSLPEKPKSLDKQGKGLFVNDFSVDIYDEEDFNEDMNFYDDDQIDDSEHLFNRQLFSDDEDDGNYDDLLDEVNEESEDLDVASGAQANTALEKEPDIEVGTLKESQESRESRESRESLSKTRTSLESFGKSLSTVGSLQDIHKSQESLQENQKSRESLQETQKTQESLQENYNKEEEQESHKSQDNLLEETTRLAELGLRNHSTASLKTKLVTALFSGRINSKPNIVEEKEYEWNNRSEIFYEDDTLNDYFEDEDYLDEVNTIPEDFDFEEEQDSAKLRNRMMRSNSYSKQPKMTGLVLSEANNKFVENGRTVTLFQSSKNSSLEDVTLEIEDAQRARLILSARKDPNDILSPITETNSEEGSFTKKLSSSFR